MKPGKFMPLRPRRGRWRCITRKRVQSLHGKRCVMIEKPNSRQAAALRLRAELKARDGKANTPEALSPEEAGRVLHDLRVHQIELEMQNEELRRTQVELEAAWVGISTCTIWPRWGISPSANRA